MPSSLSKSKFTCAFMGEHGRHGRQDLHMSFRIGCESSEGAAPLSGGVSAGAGWLRVLWGEPAGVSEERLL